MTTKRSAESDVHTCLTRQDLTEIWINAFGSTPPKRLSSRLIKYAIAYDKQVKAYGPLTPSAKRKLKAVNSNLGNRSRPGSPPKSANTSQVGTRLIREWHGVTHTVEAVESGYRFNGRTYRSLSEVARTITGARWSGPRFFGV